MRSSTVAAVFAGSVAAQSSSSGSTVTGSSAVVINALMPASTLTAIGSSAGTVTYINSCTDGGIPASWLNAQPSGSAASSLASSVRSAAGTVVLTPISAPTTTPAARLRRQDDEGGLFGGFCENVTIKQGSTSVEMNLEDPTKGVWTAAMNCKWAGDVTTADLTCTATQSGSFAELNEIAGVSTETIKASDVAAASLVNTVSVVQPASNSASQTTPAASGSSTASGSGAPAATGAAAGSPLSKGVMAAVGGAAGVFAAALAL